MKCTAYLVLICAIAPVCQIAMPASADGIVEKAIIYTKPALAIGLATTLFSSKTEGFERASKATDAVLTSVAIARMIKHAADVNLGSPVAHSFPSGHTAAAFSMATSLAHINPKHKWTYYACAALVGWSTVKTDGHGWADVAGGAALGVTVSKMSISRKGLFLTRVHKF